MLAIFNLGGGEILLLLFVLPIWAMFFGFWLWMLVDCVKNERLVGNQKVMWVLLIVLTNWIGGLIYFVLGRNKNKPA